MTVPVQSFVTNIDNSFVVPLKILRVPAGLRAVGDGGNYSVSVTNISVPSLVLLSLSNHCLRLPRKRK